MSEQTNGDASAPIPSEYMYKRDFQSAMRQNVNHFIMKGLTGWLLHPSISHPKNARVADVGCGTAIWLQELSEQLSDSAQLTGFDISDLMWPAPSWRAPQLTLILQDCFEPFPEIYIGQFDVVNVRFLRCFVGDADIDGLVRNFASLLKPGGYLQWFDGMALRSAERTTNASAPTQASQQLAAMSRSPNSETSYQWTEQLDQHVARNGFAVVASEVITFRDTYRHVWAMSTLAGIDDIRCKVDSEKAKHLQSLLGQVAEEVGQGVGMESPWTLAIGRKM